MRFVPYYTVSYHGKFYRAGAEIEIDDDDANLMGKHGKIIGVKPSEVTKTSQAVNAADEPEKPVRKAGRPRKQQ